MRVALQTEASAIGSQHSISIEPPIELKDLSGSVNGTENEENASKKRGGLVGYLKKAWKKITAPRVETESDLDSLELYYLNFGLAY